MAAVVAERPAVDRPAVDRTAPRRATGAYRPDVDGLRAVAIVLVVLFHVGFVPMSGGFVGVDVFYVVSGFLITGLLGRELATTGTISFRRFYARRARRLLPMASLVLVVTAVVAWLVMPPLGLKQVGSDVSAAALFVVNFSFAHQATDYWASSIDGSPVLHYWSLSVEEQYYVLWPILLFAVVVLARRWWHRPFPLVGALTVVFVASLALSVVLTPLSPSSSYFGLHTRAWELATGGLLALAGQRLARLGRSASAVLTATGVGMVLVAALSFDDATPYPGYAALLPVMGTALVIVGGMGGLSGVSRILATGPMVSVGRLSYSWYLWHWPVIVFVLYPLQAASPASTSAWFTGNALWVVAVVVLSFGLAWTTSRLVENPVRFAPRLAASPAASLGMAGVLIVVSVAAAGSLWYAASVPPPMTTASGVQLAMTPKEALADYPNTYGCGGSDYEAEPDCVFGDPASPIRIALVGDSHAQHWFPAFEEAARTQGWALYFWGKVGCPLTDAQIRTTSTGEVFTDCAEWRNRVIERLQAVGDFNMIVVTRAFHYGGTLVDAAGARIPSESVVDAWATDTRRTLDLLEPLTDRVLLMRDTPSSPEPVAECLSEALPNDSLCSLDASTQAHRDAALFEAEQLAAVHDSQVAFYDPTSLVCAAGVCPVVTTSGVIVFRDEGHMTATFSRSLSQDVVRFVGAQL